MAVRFQFIFLLSKLAKSTQPQSVRKKLKTWRPSGAYDASGSFQLFSNYNECVQIHFIIIFSKINADMLNVKSGVHQLRDNMILISNKIFFMSFKF